eukprot:9477569-Pyramimonas_sp.AAC.1
MRRRRRMRRTDGEDGCLAGGRTRRRMRSAPSFHPLSVVHHPCPTRSWSHFLRFCRWPFACDPWRTA